MTFFTVVNPVSSTGAHYPNGAASTAAPQPYPTVDLPDSPEFIELQQQTRNKEDAVQYALSAARLVSLGGFIGGLQEAYYTFEKLPPGPARNLSKQAVVLGKIIGRKTLFAAALGATFAFTEAKMEAVRGVDDSWNGIAGGAAAGFLFSMLPPKPWPQPAAWPLWFASAIYMSDILTVKMPESMKGFRQWGPLPGREHWGDPMPPRPPVLNSCASARPWNGHFWRDR